MTITIDVRRALCLAGALSALASCAPPGETGGDEHASSEGALALPPLPLQGASIRASDAGHVSFVRQVIPKLLGRKPAGWDEVKLLVDLIQAVDSVSPAGSSGAGRRAVVDALMEEDEFVVHWQRILSDALRVDRRGDRSQGACYDDTVSLPAAAGGTALARHVRDRPPTDDLVVGTAPIVANMAALIRSAIYLDDLSPVFRAHLFPMVNRPLQGANVVEYNRRHDLTSRFMNVYLDRDIGCLRCHNSAWSISGDRSGWDRAWPIPGFFEKALFGAHAGRDPEEVAAVFRPQNKFSGTVTPWFLDASCGSFSDPSQVPDDTDRPDPNRPQPQPHFGGATPASKDPKKVTVWDVESSLRAGVAKLASNGLDRAPTPCTHCQGCTGASSQSGLDYQTKRENARQALVAACGSSCHASHRWTANLGDANAWDAMLVRHLAPAGSTYVFPRSTGASWLYQRIDRGEMPPGGLQAAAKADLLFKLGEWIDTIPASLGCDTCAVDCGNYPRELDPDEAFAHLVAQSLVNTTYQAMFGARLTVANHFPRNIDQTQLLWGMTNHLVEPNMAGHWSLKELVRRLLASELFNRLAPVHGDGMEPYELPTVLDPWTALRMPTQPWEQSNAMTEGVHRHSPQALLHSVATALGWPDTSQFAAGGMQAPDNELKAALGQYLETALPGFDSVGFQALLSWESAFGACTRPSSVASDWIDRLVARVGAVQGAPPTYRDVVAALRDRLLGDGVVDDSFASASAGATEKVLLEQYFGVTSLDAGVTTAGLDGQLRGLCGVLVETPQFMLAGLAPITLGPRPALAEPLYLPRCQALAARVRVPGYQVFCDANASVTLRQQKGLGSIYQYVGGLCPQGNCGQLRWPVEVDLPCMSNPLDCVRQLPPCDPSCLGFDCCGDPMAMIAPDFRGALHAALAGAQVIKANGVLVMPQGAKSDFRPLAPGTVLRPGDWLRLPAGSAVDLAMGKQQLSTPEGGVKPRPVEKGDGSWVLLVSAAGAKDNPLAFPGGASAAPPMSMIQALDAAEWNRWGAAGRPRSTTAEGAFGDPR